MDKNFGKPSADLKGQIEQRLQHMGTASLGQASVDVFFALPGAKLWKPEQVLLGEISYVVDIGLPLSIIGLNRLPSDYLEMINQSVAAGQYVSSELWSEIEVATILTHYGAEIEFVPRSTIRTADLRAKWTVDVHSDIEVTRGEVRHLHKSVQDGVKDFVQALRPGDVDWHIMGFVADASDNNALSAAFDAAISLRPGQSIDEPNSWYVTAVNLDEREAVVGGRTIELFSPSWWPKNEPSYFSTSTFLNGRGNPVVALRSLIPHVSYMNPLIRKAWHGQHAEGVPYLIALNASDLPGAHIKLKDDIFLNFETWDHVSGVLIYYPLFYLGAKKKVFQFQIFQNPNANSVLPDELTSLANRDINKLEFIISKKYVIAQGAAATVPP